MENQFDSIKQLFQQEFSKMVAVISKGYGLQHIEIAEDIVSETFLLAAETWGTKGMPPNPAAWLYAVAKQKTLYHFRRNRIYQDKVVPAIKDSHEQTEWMQEPDFSNENIRDSQLQMLFAICNPAIAGEAQIGLALRILCGFGIDEIAEAFLTGKETINKRLFRAKEKLRTEKIRLEPIASNTHADAEIQRRLDNVLHIIYLLFNEGYYSRSNNEILRKDLCLEAMRLAIMLTGYEKTDLPETNALLALMCFHASRFHARQNKEDAMVLYEQQDESLWDTALIAQGMHYLQRSARGTRITSYHLEAKIASWHCMKADTPEKWQDILHCYDQLMQINYSPSVALNRAFALYKVKGAPAALAEAEKLELEHNHFYFLLLGELYRHLDTSKAALYYRRAHALARTDKERQGILEKIDTLS